MDVSNFCCSFENEDGVQGSGVLMQFTGIENPQKLGESLPGLKYLEADSLETMWAIFTCHRVFPGDLESLQGWKLRFCIGKKALVFDLDSVVCNTVSCCASKSFISQGAHTAGTQSHLNRPCLFDLDFTVLFCSHQFVELFIKDKISPPCIPIPCTSNDLESLITVVNDAGTTMAKSVLSLYNLDHGIVPLDKFEPSFKPLSSDSRLKDEIETFQSLQYVHYDCKKAETIRPTKSLSGSPIIFTNPKSKQNVVIGFHVCVEEDSESEGRKPYWDQKSKKPATRYFGNTIFGVVQVLQGGPVAVLAVLENPQARRLWPNRWNHLLLPYLEPKEDSKIELVRLLDILHALTEKAELKDRLIALNTSVTIDARLASLELIGMLFAHFEEHDGATLASTLSDTGLGNTFGEEIKGDLRHIFRGIETALRGMKGRYADEVHDATTVEAYFKCYNMIMNFRHVFVHEHIRANDYKALQLLTDVSQKFDSVQKNWREIVQKCWKFEQSVAGYLIDLIVKEREETVKNLKFENETLKHQIHSLKIDLEQERKFNEFLRRQDKEHQTQSTPESDHAKSARMKRLKRSNTFADEKDLMYIIDNPKRKKTEAQNTGTQMYNLHLNMANLSLIKWSNDDGENFRLRLLPSISPKWYQAGILLGLSGGELKTISATNQGHPDTCCVSVFTKWLENGGNGKYCTTWEGVIELLDDLELSMVAIDLQNALEHFIIVK